MQNWKSTNAGEPSSSSSLVYKFTTSSYGSTISFDWSVSSESGYDFLIVTLDGSEIIRESGEISSSFSTTIYDDSEHQLECTYRKDGSGDNNDDCAMIYNIIGSNITNATPLFNGVDDYAVSITTTEAGTLESLLSSQSPKSITSLTISGPLNAKDLIYIKSLFCGDWLNHNEYKDEMCNLQSLNLLDARFVKSKYNFTNDYNYEYEFCLLEDSCFSDIRYINDLNNYCRDYYLNNNKSLKSLILPSNIKFIQDIRGGAILENIILSESLEEIYDYAFSECGIKSVSIPRNVNKIGIAIFEHCYNLEHIDVDLQNKFFNGWANMFGSNSIIGYDNKLYAGCKNTNLAAWGFRKIGIGAFYGCEGLTEIEIPSFVEIIDNAAFSECKKLKSVKFNEGLKRINNQAFYNCKLITEISFPNSLDSLGNMVFAYCNIKEVKLPKNLKWYGRTLRSTLREEKPDVQYAYPLFDHSLDYYEYQSPFSGNPIDKICVDIENPYYESIDDACIVETASQSLIDGFGAFTIPNSVRRLADMCLYNNSSKEIVIPDNVESIVHDNLSLYNRVYKVLADTPPVIEKLEVEKKRNTEISYYGKANVYVHAWSLAKYKADPLWSKNNLYPIENMYCLVDGTAYNNSENVDYEAISYTRTFNHTKWQALYIPFSMSYEDWKNDFDIAYINGIRQYDMNDDGAIDETVMDVIKIKQGSLIPNTPYLIRAKTTGEKTFTVNNATLYKAEENSIDCRTTIAEYTFTGTYSTIHASTLIANNYYAMGDGSLVVTDGTSDLKPFRWYMKIDARSPMYNVSLDARAITINVIGDEETTGVSQLQITNDELPVYDLNGRKVNENNLKPGIYVKNGKKVVIK